MDNRNDMIGNYLRQQSALAVSNASQSSSVPPINNSQDIIVVPPENISLEEFKEYVKKYLELDNWLRKAQEVFREKKKAKDKLSEIITNFMIRYDIDDLNSKFGKISCKVKKVRQPVTQKNIKDKITDYFKDKPTECQNIIQTVFEDRPVVEKVSLRRLRVT